MINCSNEGVLLAGVGMRVTCNMLKCCILKRWCVFVSYGLFIFVVNETESKIGCIKVVYVLQQGCRLW